MSAHIDFTLADQPPWPRPPARPVAVPVAPRRVRTCMPVVDVSDAVAAPVAFTVSDEDPVRDRVPVIRIGCIGTSTSLHDPSIRGAFRSNLGAFRRCYADAHDRDPALAGTLAVRATFGPGGIATHVAVSGPGDDVFHACMATAAYSVWLAPSDRAVQVTYPFELADDDDDDDPDARLAALAAQLARPVVPLGPLAACRARVDVLDALVARAPWPDDPRTTAALRELGAFARTLPRATSRACLADRIDAIAALAPRTDTRWSSLERIEAVLPLAMLARADTWIVKLRLARAQLLVLDRDRRAEGVAELEALARSSDATTARFARMLVDDLPATYPLVDHGC